MHEKMTYKKEQLEGELEDMHNANIELTKKVEIAENELKDVKKAASPALSRSDNQAETLKEENAVLKRKLTMAMEKLEDRETD